MLELKKINKINNADSVLERFISIWEVSPLSLSPITIWFTGLPAAGKTTLARALYSSLKAQSHKVEWLDGDKVRRLFSQDLDFSRKDRIENIRRIAQLAKSLNDKGIAVIVSAITPYEEMRQMARKIIGKDKYIEAYVKCPLEVCKKRDPKGLYKKAEKGEIKNFTGISDVYEEPESPNIVVETKQLHCFECINKIITYLEKKNKFSNLFKRI